MKKLNKNDNNGKIRLLMKMTFKLYKDINFICKIFYLKKIGIQLSRRLNNYIPEICENVQEVDYQGTECKSFFQIFKWAGAI